MMKYIILISFLVTSCSFDKGLTSLHKNYKELPISDGLNKIENEVETVFNLNVENFVIFEISESTFIDSPVLPKNILYLILINPDAKKIIDRVVIYKWINDNWIKLNLKTITPDFIYKIAYNEKYSSNSILTGNFYEYNIWIRYNEIEYIKCNTCFGLLPNTGILTYKYFTIVNYLLTNLMISELLYQLYD